MSLRVSEDAISAAQQTLPKPVVDPKLYYVIGEGLGLAISNQIIQMMGREFV